MTSFDYYVQGNRRDVWWPSQKWQENLFVDGNKSPVAYDYTSYTPYAAIKFNDTNDVDYLNRPHIKKEVGLIGNKSGYFLNTKYLKTESGIICNLNTGTCRVYIKILDDNSISEFKHTGPTLMTEDKRLKLYEEFMKVRDQIIKTSDINVSLNSDLQDVKSDDTSTYTEEDDNINQDEYKNFDSISQTYPKIDQTSSHAQSDDFPFKVDVICYNSSSSPSPNI